MTTSVLTKATSNPIGNDSVERMRGLLAAAEPRLQRRFLDAVRFVQSQFTIDELAALIEAGRINEALATVELAAAQFASAWVAVYTAAATDTAALINRELNTLIDFDASNHRAIAEIRANRLRLIREFTEEQRATVREVVRQGFRTVQTFEREGFATARQVAVNPREMARNFRGSIGLTAKQQEWVGNYRRNLETRDSRALTRLLRDRRFDPTVRRAIDLDQPLSSSQIDRMVERYQERWLKYRSEVIARTESLRSVHGGVEEMYAQAVESGELDPEELVRTWIVRKDGLQRDHHDSMSRQKRKIGERFVSGQGNLLIRPGDPSAPASETVQCRCVVTTRFALSDAANERLRAADEAA